MPLYDSENIRKFDKPYKVFIENEASDRRVDFY